MVQPYRATQRALTSCRMLVWARRQSLQQEQMPVRAEMLPEETPPGGAQHYSCCGQQVERAVDYEECSDFRTWQWVLVPWQRGPDMATAIQAWRW